VTCNTIKNETGNGAAVVELFFNLFSEKYEHKKKLIFTFDF